ncbi:MAG: molybdenum cofactor guanylyltransferase [Chloroflexi bacterium]|nr:molybdenum cofactor guanylyltransferase [Chloroflexota bacterium]
MGTDIDVSGVVLAGGLSRRLGRDKAVEPVDGVPLIGRVISRLSEVSQQTVVVVNEPGRVAALPLPTSAKTAVDIYPGKGSLGGIFTGLSAADGEWAFVVSCDMPFLNTALLSHMLSLREGFDVVVPVIDGRPEPTHALYNKACLPHMQRRLEADELKIIGFFEEVKVFYLAEEELDRFDPEHLSFFNVNTQEDLDRAQALAAQGR